jgi:hypothetical protein
LALVILSCESTSPEDIGPSIGGLLDDTATPAAGAATATERPALVQGRSTPMAQASPAPGPGMKPHVLWMLRDHGGTNLAVVRFAASVEVSAVLTVLGGSGQPVGVEPQTTTTYAREHTISTPLSPMPGSASPPTFLSLEVTDRHGAKASAALEYGNAIAGTQYWARTDDQRPAFTWTAPFRGNATWTNIAGPTSPPVSVQVFAKRAGCTTAEQCAPAPVAAFSTDTRTPLEGAERHSIPVDLPATPEQDFQLLYTVFIDGDQPASLFYQRDIPRSAAVAGRD